MRRSLQDELRSPIQGWFGQREQFEMDRPYEPDAGVRRFLAGTPPILGLAAVDVGAELVGEAGIERIRAKAGSLDSLAIDVLRRRARGARLRARHAARGAPARRPRLAAPSRGLAHLPRPDRAGRDVVPDFRGPDSIRLGLSPLSTSHAEVVEALVRLRDLVARGEHLELCGGDAARVT